MADLVFEVELRWCGTGKDGEGDITMEDASLRYSAPAEMGGKGTGASPEDLLISAVSSCYSATLFGTLKRAGLPVQLVRVRAEGIVIGYPTQTKFSNLIVHPTIVGGDEAKWSDYETAAATAHRNCFIGKAIAGNIAYELGEVQVVPE